MATQVNILFTGICLFLTDSNRVILGVADGRRDCTNSADISKHHAYLKYTAAQRTSGKTVWQANGVQEAVRLSGLVEFAGNFVKSTLTYPGSNPALPNVVVIKAIAPLYTPLATVLESDHTKIDSTIVAARVDLPPGDILSPTATNEFWHFFPPKGTLGVRMKLAQAVQLVLHVTDDQIQVTERSFAGGGATDAVTLKGGGAPIMLTIGNSSGPDIAPLVTSPKPAIGPDYDFELHWNLFDRQGDIECPPLSYNEGTPGGGLVTLGGGNCPPSQWP